MPSSYAVAATTQRWSSEATSARKGALQELVGGSLLGRREAGQARPDRRDHVRHPHDARDALAVRFLVGASHEYPDLQPVRVVDPAPAEPDDRLGGYQGLCLWIVGERALGIANLA